MGWRAAKLRVPHPARRGALGLGANVGEPVYFPNCSKREAAISPAAPVGFSMRTC
jgi:hypothetical protein